MTDKEERYAEAYRRGILPEDKKEQYEEAVKRGLMNNPDLKMKLSGISLPDIPAPPKNEENQALLGVEEAARALTKAGAGLINIAPEMADAFSSAGAWAGKKMGLGDGTYKAAPRISLPGWATPQTDAGKMAAEVIPFFVAIEAKAAEAPQIAQRLTSWGSKIMNMAGRTGETTAKRAAENITGTLANTDENQDNLASNLAGNMALGQTAHIAGKILGAMFKGVRGAVSGGAKNAEEEIIKNLGLAGDAETQRILGQLSPEVQAELARRISPEGNNAGVKAIADQLKRGVRSDLVEVAENVNPDQKVLDVMKEFGFEPATTPTAYYSKNPQYVALERGLKSKIGSKLADEDISAMAHLSGEADKILQKFKGTHDLSEVSQKTLDNMNDIRGGLLDESNKLYGELNNKIPAQSSANTDAIVNFVEARLNNLGKKSLLMPGEREILETLKPTITRHGSVRGERIEKSKINYAALDQVRKNIDLARRQAKGPFANADAGLLGELEGKLIESQKKTIDDIAPEMNPVFDEARNLIVKRKDIENNILKLYGQTKDGDITKKLTQAVTDLSKGSHSGFERLMQRIPEDMRQYVAMSAMTRAFTGKSRTAGKSIDPVQFSNWFKGMSRNSESRKVLEKYLPKGAMDTLSRFHTLNEGVSKAIKADVNTGRIVSITDAFDSANDLANQITQKTSKAILGKVPFVGNMIANSIQAGASSGAKMANATDVLMTPEFRNLAKEQGVRNTASKHALFNAEEALKKSEKFKKWEKILTPSERQIIASQGIIKGLAAIAKADSEAE